ncbi:MULTISPECIES: winged helix DNA-binding domain-containing protein [unclassified Streptomyces]|uniref:winged helix DNA-binding domain-containing protein n=1 Tax=unclassified Streptomyces TaxID=2593676 RepID=UPI000B500983|nr:MULTISPECIES: winged helix DNA-binding domain-containing protein [unclassified Streptomyces]MYX00087.1 winged helix DNA-binding domain-containing protein [Streptomyces sp. SID8378]SNB87082.1 Winged helix DNA-binding domain-containing protein [Streptomyces sp. PgraA7]
MAAKTHRTAAPTTVLSTRALNRATLDRQLLLRRSPMSAKKAVTHLVGLQAQNTKPPYFQLYARLADFDPEELSALMEAREVVRTVSLRSTLHTHTADDAVTLVPLVRAPRDRELKSFRRGLEGVDLDRLAAATEKLVEERPRPLGELRGELLTHWPDADPLALSVAARCVLPLVQVTPRGLWGRSGQVALTTVEQWLGRSAGSAPALTLDDTVLRYLGAFGPASVMDFQSWAGLTRTKEVFERLRPGLLTFRDERGVELFDLPDAPRPDPDTPAPPRFLPEFDNVLLGHADRTRVIPEVNKGRNGKGKQTYGSVLVDGFLDALWRVDREGQTAVLTVQTLRNPTRAQRAEITEEAGRMLTVMTDAEDHDVRFGTFLDFKD